MLFFSYTLTSVLYIVIYTYTYILSIYTLLILIYSFFFTCTLSNKLKFLNFLFLLVVLFKLFMRINAFDTDSKFKMIHKLSVSPAIVLIMIFLVNHLNANTITNHHPGDGKPFGSTGPFLELETFTDNTLDSKTFFESYVRPKKAVLLRRAALEFPARKLWTDEYLYKAADGHDDYKLVIETEKKESRDQNIFNLNMREFLNQYRQKEIYMVNTVPPFLRFDVCLPLALQCEKAHDALEETVRDFFVATLFFSC